MAWVSLGGDSQAAEAHTVSGGEVLGRGHNEFNGVCKREQQQEFLRLYSLIGSEKLACEQIGMTRSRLYYWLSNDREFMSLYLDAQSKLPKEPPGRTAKKYNDSLCWYCLRSGWDCLCQYPAAEPPGLKTVTKMDAGEAVKMVVDCPMYWPA